jgi:hypothetical protein
MITKKNYFENFQELNLKFSGHSYNYVHSPKRSNKSICISHTSATDSNQDL